MNYRIGYIGFGGMAGGYHYDTAMREDVPFTPTAVYDVNPARRAYAESKGLKAFDNIGDFLASRIFDIVLVATPNQFHCPYVCAALEAGYHAMSEKPAAMTSAEIERMMAAARKAGKVFTVHHNRRFDRDCLIVKEALQKGYCGDLITVENRIHAKSGGSGHMFGWREFADHGGGMLGDWGVHMLDQTLYLFEDPIQSVFASVKTIRSYDVDDYAKILIRFQNGLTAQVESTTFSPYPMPKWWILGNRGSIYVEDCCGETGKARFIAKSHTEDADILLYPGGSMAHRTIGDYKVDEWEEVALPEHTIPQDWAALYKNLAAHLDGKEELVVTPESVLRCFRVIEAARKSSETGLAVEF